jgi:hypothetical protein
VDTSRCLRALHLRRDEAAVRRPVRERGSESLGTCCCLSAASRSQSRSRREHRPTRHVPDGEELCRLPAVRCRQLCRVRRLPSACVLGSQLVDIHLPVMRQLRARDWLNRPPWFHRLRWLGPCQAPGNCMGAPFTRPAQRRSSPPSLGMRGEQHGLLSDCHTRSSMLVVWSATADRLRRRSAERKRGEASITTPKNRRLLIHLAALSR